LTGSGKDNELKETVLFLKSMSMPDGIASLWQTLWELQVYYILKETLIGELSHSYALSERCQFSRDPNSDLHW